MEEICCHGQCLGMTEVHHYMRENIIQELSYLIPKRWQKLMDKSVEVQSECCLHRRVVKHGSPMCGQPGCIVQAAATFVNYSETHLKCPQLKYFPA
jgi:hypothetical protein